MTFFNNVNLINNFGSFPINKLGFRGSDQQIFPQNYTQGKDAFSTNPLYDNFGTKAQIEAIAKSNPTIVQMLKENKIPLKVNVKELEDLKKGHLKNSRVTAAKMYSNLPNELKRDVNLSDLQQAAMLHDYGKVLIPNEILNKKGALTPDERKIMELHSELGYELLKTQNLKQSVLDMIKYHHQNPAGTGYPQAHKDFEYNTELAMLAAADKYSALTENRSYKSAMPRGEALEIIQKDVDTGQLPQEVFDALKKSVSSD